MFSHLKRRIGVLTAVAVLAALVPTLSISPAAAAASATAVTLNDTATFVSCPSGSAAAAGFTDTTSTDVDCIAMYGITTGVTATTYEPTASVPRWQMALYLTRFLSEAGYTLGSGADQGFTDISGESAAIQTAINQIKQAGVTTGTTATTYSPADNVSREQIAMFIERALALLTPGPGGNSDDVLTTKISGLAANLLTYSYTDIDANVTFEGHNAIIELLHLGVTGDTGAVGETYRPTVDMTRAEMATFLTNAAAHTNLRPEGMWFQTDLATKAGTWTPVASVSYRDAAFDPISGALVDIFSFTPTGVEGFNAFLSTGLCDDTLGAGSITKCTIDVGEVSTGATGNMVPSTSNVAPTGVTTVTETYYAWTAAAGTVYDNDVNGSGTTFATATVTATAAAAETRCSIDTPANGLVATADHTVKYGTVTTITCQVTDGTTSTSGNVPLALRDITMNQSRVFTTDSVGSQDNDIVLTTNTVGLTDATGAVTFTITGPADPSTGDDLHTETITLTATGENINDGASLANGQGYMGPTGVSVGFSLLYDDDDAAATTTTLTQTASSGAISAVTGTTRSVSATVYDQYGDTVAGNSVALSSGNALPSGLACTSAAQAVCTSVAAHGLASNDILEVVTPGAFLVKDGLPASVAAGTKFCVDTVNSTTEFTLDNADCLTSTDSSAVAGVASTDISPLVVVAQSFAPVSRTSNSAGVASFSWSDKTSTSGSDSVTAIGAGATSATKTFYRLATAASFTEVGVTDDATLDDGDTLSKLVEWDSTNDDFVIASVVGATATNPVTTYLQYSYDANDQFVIDGAVAAGSGTATTMALWETAMLAKTAVVGGTYGDVSGVAYQALSTGVAVFKEGA